MARLIWLPSSVMATGCLSQGTTTSRCSRCGCKPNHQQVLHRGCSGEILMMMQWRTAFGCSSMSTAMETTMPEPTWSFSFRELPFPPRIGIPVLAVLKTVRSRNLHLVANPQPRRLRRPQPKPPASAGGFVLGPANAHRYSTERLVHNPTACATSHRR